MDDKIIIDIEKKLFTSSGELNLSIHASISLGELVVVFGNSGAGKTTLLRMLSGLTNPGKGFIQCGNSVWFDSDAKINVKPQQRSIGYMFQDYALFPNMTVLENICFAQKTKDINQARKMLQDFELDEFANRKPTKLSGGQKQRVALARALVQNPQLLLLDEPLSALDAGMRSTLQSEIAKAHGSQNTTTFLVSHDMTEVFRLAHKVLRIEQGCVQSFGTPDEVFINNNISGKVQITGTIARIETFDTFFLLTIITGLNQIIKVTAFKNDMENLSEGDTVVVFSKAFNPIVMKV